MTVKVGDILRRKFDGLHWMIVDEDRLDNDVIRLKILVLEDNLFDYWTCVFGPYMSSDHFEIVG